MNSTETWIKWALIDNIVINFEKTITVNLVYVVCMAQVGLLSSTQALDYDVVNEMNKKLR